MDGKDYIRKINSYLFQWVGLAVLIFLFLSLGDYFKSTIVWMLVGIIDLTLFITMGFISYRLHKIRWEYYRYLKQQAKEVWELSHRNEPPDLK